MTNVNSLMSNSTSSSSYISKGISGLASGMDTDSVVESMTSDIQAKINKVKQQQQSYSWKQEAYRSVITSLTDFQSKYFSYASSKNILSSSFFNCTSMVAGGNNSGKINVSGLSTTTSATYSISSISQLASKAAFSSKGAMTTQPITTGEISFDERDASILAGTSMSIKYGNQTLVVDVPTDAMPSTAEELAEVLNKAMKEETLSSGGTLADKLQFTASSDGKMWLSAKDSADSNSFSILRGSDELLTALHMEAGEEGSARSRITGTSAVKSEELIKKVKFDLTGKNLTFDLDGSSKTFTFTEEDNNRIANAYATGSADALAEMQKLLQEKIDAKFGKDESGNSKVAVGINADGNGLTFDTANKTSILKLTSTSGDTLTKNGIFNVANGETNRLANSKTLSELGFTASSTDADGKNVYSIKVNGVQFDFNDDDTVSKVLNTINNSEEAGVNITFLNTTGRFNITADDSGSSGQVMLQDSGSGNMFNQLMGIGADASAAATYDDYKAALATQTDAVSIKDGQDLKMSIRYEGSDTDTEIVRSSNTVSIDGINFTATGKFDASASGVYNEEEAITFTAKSDTENIITTIKEMAEDYNKIIDTISKLTNTKKDKDYDYSPLTDAQKKQMSEDEIKAWEDRAKSVVLYNDSTLNQLASNLRFVFSTSIANVGAASSIGISTSSTYSDNGKITVDEAKLKEALEKDPEKVKSMFQSSAESSPSNVSSYLDGGIATRLQNITETYAKSTGSYKGKLVGLAGLANNATTSDNYIARQQKILTNKLDYLNDLLKTRQDRYQSQFSKLEVYISNMNAQSSWLASSFQ